MIPALIELQIDNGRRPEDNIGIQMKQKELTRTWFQIVKAPLFSWFIQKNYSVVRVITNIYPHLKLEIVLAVSFQQHWTVKSEWERNIRCLWNLNSKSWTSELWLIDKR